MLEENPKIYRQGGSMVAETTCDVWNAGVAELGQVILRARKAKRLSQGALARLAQLDRQTISNIETGRTKDLRGAGFRNIAAALGMTPEELDAQVQADEETSPAVSDEMWEKIRTAAQKVGKTPEELLVDFLLDVERKVKPSAKRTAPEITTVVRDHQGVRRVDASTAARRRPSAKQA